MLLCIFLVYLLAIWIIFYKLKIAVLDLKAKVIVFAIGLGIVAVVFFMVQRYAPYTKDVYVQTFVVEMAPQVGGRVTEVLVDEGAPVAAGDPLFRLDDEPYRLRVEQLQAQLVEAQQEAFGQMAALDAAGRTVRQAETAVTVAEKALQSLEAARTSAAAAVDKAQAQYELSMANFQRGKQLVETDAISREEYDTRLRQARVDQAALVEAKQRRAQADTEVESGRAQLVSARAGVLAAFAAQRQVQSVVEPLATIDQIIAENEARRGEAQKLLDAAKAEPDRADEPGGADDPSQGGTESGETADSATPDAESLRGRIKQLDTTVAEARRLRPFAEAIEKQLQGRFAKVDRVRAELARAEFDLEQTTVVAPSDGHVSNLQLAPGAFAGAGQPVMSFVDTQRPWVVAVVPENGLELVKSGDRVELAIAMYPGEVFSGEVDSIVWGAGQAQDTPSGRLPDVTTTTRKQRFMVRLDIGDPRAEQPLRQGSTATAAIYTGHGKVLHVIRKVQVRIQSMLNYLYL